MPVSSANYGREKAGGRGGRGRGGGGEGEGVRGV